MRLKFRIAFLLGIVLFALPIQAQEIDVFEDDKLKGSVHTIRTETNLYIEIDGKVLSSLDDSGWLFLSEIEYDQTQKVIKASRHVGCATGRDFRKRERLTLDTQIIEFVYGRSGNIEEKIIHARGIDGKIFRTDRFDKEGKLIARWIYLYEIDRNGNWIKREAIFVNAGIVSENIVMKTVERRVITYYANRE